MNTKQIILCIEYDALTKRYVAAIARGVSEHDKAMRALKRAMNRIAEAFQDDADIQTVETIIPPPPPPPPPEDWP